MTRRNSSFAGVRTAHCAGGAAHRCGGKPLIERRYQRVFLDRAALPDAEPGRRPPSQLNTPSRDTAP